MTIEARVRAANAALMAIDDTYQAEIARLYPGDSLARYQPRGKGAEGTELRRLYLAFREAATEHTAAWNAYLNRGQVAA